MHAAKLVPNYIIIVYQLCHTLLCDVHAMPNWYISQHNTDGVLLLWSPTQLFICAYRIKLHIGDEA